MTAPSLSQFFTPKMAVIGMLGVASGLPAPLLGDAVSAWATERGVDLATVTLLGFMTLPLGIKFLWSPWLDRRLGSLPRRKGWLIILQSLVACGIAGMAVCDPGGHMAWLVWIMLLLAFLSASQDVVIDGYRADALTSPEVGFGSAAATAGWRVGAFLASAMVFPLAKHFGWPVAYLCMAAVQASTVIVAIFAREPAASSDPTPRSFADTVIDPFRSFCREHGSLVIWILLFAMFYKLSDGIGNRLAVPFLIHLGYDGDHMGLRGSLGMPLAIAGGFMGGIALPWLGMKWALIIGGVLQAASNLVYVVLVGVEPAMGWIVVLACVENLSMGIAVAAFMGFLLTCCQRQWSGTQYALLTAAMFLGSIILGSVSGNVAKWFGYRDFFLFTVLAGIPGLLMVPVVLRRSDQSADRT